eukprot:663322-Amphidinium_carterae.1
MCRYSNLCNTLCNYWALWQSESLKKRAQNKSGNSKKGKDDPKPQTSPLLATTSLLTTVAEAVASVLGPMFHPRLSKEDGRCFNCAGKGHTSRECDKPSSQRSRNETGRILDTGKGNPSTGKSGGGKAKGKAKAKRS